MFEKIVRFILILAAYSHIHFFSFHLSLFSPFEIIFVGPAADIGFMNFLAKYKTKNSSADTVVFTSNNDDDAIFFLYSENWHKRGFILYINIVKDTGDKHTMFSSV